jgi:hypothetical protein
MENIVDLIATEGSPSDISAAIKDALFAKSADKVNLIRPDISASIFGNESIAGDVE